MGRVRLTTVLQTGYLVWVLQVYPCPIRQLTTCASHELQTTEHGHMALELTVSLRLFTNYVFTF